jgi:thymidylate synthase (FAD)
MRIDVLDHGFVELMTAYGSDLTIANAARESHGGHAHTEFDRADEALIKQMGRASPRHETPFRFVGIHFRLKWPIFVARQAMRHNVGINWIEKSLRYTKKKPEFYMPSGMEITRLQDAYHEAESTYQKLLEDDVPPEIARLCLPLGTYTQCQAHFSLQAFAHFVALRLDVHAQHEIWLYAKAMRQIASSCFPVSLEAILEK